MTCFLPFFSRVMVPPKPSVHQTVPPRTTTWKGASTVESSLRWLSPAAAGFADAGALMVALRASAPETAATAAVVRVLLRRRMDSSRKCEWDRTVGSSGGGRHPAAEVLGRYRRAL